MMAGTGPRCARSLRFWLLALLLAGGIAHAGAARAGEQAFIRTGTSALTAFDAADFVPLGSVPLTGTSLWGLATSPATQRLYAFDINTQTVLAVDVVRRAVVETIPLTELRFTPYGMAVSADGKRLYFAAQNRALGLIAIDLERRLLMAEVAVPYAQRVVPHPTLDKLWVTTKTGELFTLRASDLSILAHQQLQGAEIALSDDGARLYLTGDRSSLLVMDAATDAVLGQIPTGFHATAFRIAGRWAYLGHKELGVLRVIDLVDGHLETDITLDTGQYVRVGGIDATADGSRVVVLLDNNLRYKFAVVDGAAHTLLGLHEGVSGSVYCSSRFVMPVTVPQSVFTVNSTADVPDAARGDGVCETAAGNGVCTLRAAVQEGNAAAGTALIEVPAGEYALSIPGADEDGGATGDLDVSGRLTIHGAGSETTVVDGGALDRVLDVAAGGSLGLAGVTVRNGRLPFRGQASLENGGGAGLRNQGVLTLSGVAVADNRTEGFGGAGVHSTGVLRAEDCTFSGNSSVGSICWLDILGNQVCGESGGVAAVYARQAEIRDSRFTANASAVAVRIDGSLERCVVSDNEARGVVATSVSRSTISGNRGPGCSAGLVTDSTVSGNVNTDPDGCGGGIAWLEPYHKLVVARSTISGNAASRGGGVCAQFFEMENATVSGNAATGDGGGIFVREYDEWNHVRNCTITGNTADSDGDGSGDGGGIFNQHPDTYYDTHLTNTILAGNVDRGGQAPDCAGYLGSSQFNLVGDAAGCGFDALEWDVVGSPESPIDPGLAPLADNGGPTATHALLAGSPAVDGGHPYIFPATDQRGVARPQDGDLDGTAHSDIGAFELAPLSWKITAAAGPNGSITPVGEVVVADGGSSIFAIAPDARYRVADVLVDGASVGPVNTWSFDEVSADHTITATFEAEPVLWTIAASAGPNGSITPAGAVVVPDGGSRSFAIAPDTHYHVADVQVDGASVGPVNALYFDGVTADHIVAATFAIDTYTVTANAWVNGSIWPKGRITVPHGGSVTFRVVPRAGYRVARLVVDGRNVGPRTWFRISGCSGNHSIQARFSRIY
ncbi:MAG TPA: choice-of-anchor Q domain-containing protein [bacterium]